MKKELVTVKVQSEVEWQNYCHEHDISDDTVENIDGCFIEVLNTHPNGTLPSEATDYYPYLCFRKQHPNALVLVFDDIEHDIFDKGRLFKAMTHEQANKLYDFIKRNIGKKEFVVHCSAGISRSGAIGRFIVDYLKYNNRDVHFPDSRKILPNYHVLAALNNSFYSDTK